MKCYNCGNDIPDECSFCYVCGAKISADAVTSEEDGFSQADDVIIEDTENENTCTAEEDSVEQKEENSDTPQENESEEQEFVLRHCQNCGAALMGDAKFCSNCGSRVTGGEIAETPKKKRSSVPLVIAIIAAAVILLILTVLANAGGDIEGEWLVERRGTGSMFDMFGSAYLEFDDDGTAVYYDGMFNTQHYDYSYNKFTKTLRLKSTAASSVKVSVITVDWIDEDTVSLSSLDMILHRTDDIPFSYDDYYDDDDVVVF